MAKIEFELDDTILAAVREIAGDELEPFLAHLITHLVVGIASRSEDMAEAIHASQEYSWSRLVVDSFDKKQEEKKEEGQSED